MGNVWANVLPVSEFRDLLESVAKRYQSKGAFAKALGITPGRLSRVLGGEHSLEVQNCLKLAKMTGESPSRILRVAGKGDLADLIESMYGPGRAAAVSPSERELLDRWDKLNTRSRSLVLGILDELLKQGAKHKKSRSAS